MAAVTQVKQINNESNYVYCKHCTAGTDYEIIWREEANDSKQDLQDHVFSSSHIAMRRKATFKSFSNMYLHTRPNNHSLTLCHSRGAKQATLNRLMDDDRLWVMRGTVMSRAEAETRVKAINYGASNIYPTLLHGTADRVAFPVYKNSRQRSRYEDIARDATHHRCCVHEGHLKV